MTYKLWKHVAVGNKILLKSSSGDSRAKITELGYDWVKTTAWYVAFGDDIEGWKIS